MFPFNAVHILEIQEEERLEEIRTENVNRRIMREQSDPFAIDDIRFVELFRLNKDLAQFMLNQIIPQLDNSNNPVTIPGILKFFGTLSFYATGTYQRVIGQSFNLSMSQQSMSRAIEEVTNCIVNTFSEQWIRFPRTLVEKNMIKGRFMEITNFPGVIGLIDCTHVEIIRPQIEEHNYFNRKGYHSKNIQLICDCDFKILNINSRFGGAAHDSYIWRQSQARLELEANNQRGDRNTWLLGDSGYPLEPWLMTPVINAEAGSPEFRYTERHIRTRNIVERCIGIYKARFLCLSKVLRYTPEKVGNIANACAILHNMCMAARLNIDFNVQLHYDNIQEPPAAPQVNVNRDGIAIRRKLIQRYFN